jgi:hypothetical protein
VPSDIVVVDDFLLFVGEADDDYALPGGLLEPEVGNRFVLFTVATANEASVRRWIEENDFRLKDSSGDKHRPVLVTVDGIETPEYLDSGETGLVAVLFEIDGGSRPEELTYSPSFGFKKRVKFIIE